MSENCEGNFQTGSRAGQKITKELYTFRVDKYSIFYKKLKFAPNKQRFIYLAQIFV